MYEAFFHLREKPFSLLPDPEYLYLGKQHTTAFTMLDYGLNSQAGFTVISGDVGSGKTTLIRHLLNQHGADVTVGLITNTHRNLGSLLRWVLLAFSLDYRRETEIECYETLIDFMIKEYSQGRRVVLIVDEAQNMGAEKLEELRVLSNVNADKDQIIQLILVGQPELREILRHPELVQFAQRIAVDYHLGPLDERDTIGYIQHRLRVAGGDPELLSLEACQRVYRASQGIPRLINTLCDTALVYAYGANQPHVTSGLIQEVVDDKMRGGLFGRVAAPTDDPQPQPSSSPDPEEHDILADHPPKALGSHGEFRAKLDELKQEVEKLTRHLAGTVRPRR